MKIKNLSIKSKLLIAFFLLFLFSSIIAAYSYYSINFVVLNNPSKSIIDNINVTYLSAKQNEKNFITYDTKEELFLTEGTSQYLINLEKNIQTILKRKEELKELNFANSPLALDLLSQLEKELTTYEGLIKKIAEAYKKRGFKTFGIEGELRKSIHGIEKSGLVFDEAKMLMLRRHEKDFFLRKDVSYLGKFKADAATFSSSLIENENTIALLDPLSKYMAQFEEIVNIEIAIGLDEKSGLIGEIALNTDRITSIIKDLNSTAEQNIKTAVTNTMYLLFLLIVLQIGLSVLLVFYFIKAIVKPIELINSKAKTLAKGKIPSIDKVDGNDEVAQTQHSFNELIDKTKNAIKFAHKIGEGDFEYKFKAHSKDKMGNALLEMRQKLRDIQVQQELAKVEEEKQNWATEGVAFFGELLRKSNNNLQEMSYEVLKHIADYVNAQQGGIYIKNKGEGNKDVLTLSAVFSGDRRKYTTKQLDFGEGIIGQTAKENKKVVFSKIPESYNNIDTGMANFKPAMVLVIPLSVNGEIQGVMELSSIAKFEDHVILFLEKLAESIASTIANVRVNETTKVLLENSQKMSEELRAQEEELRQNQEEMQATQEELNRQLREAQNAKDELLARIFELESKLKG